MFVTSTITDGNMHPSLDRSFGEAEQNFSTFCDKQSIDPKKLIGLRIDPSIPNADRISLGLDHNAFSEHRGSVDVDKRLSTNALILVGEARESTGAFTLAADCFPVSIEGVNSSTLMHIGRSAIKNALIDKTFGMIAEHDDLEDVSVSIGPGVKSFCRVLPRIVKACCDSGVNRDSIILDGRNTFTDTTLYSRRASKLPIVQRPRGNHVSVMYT